MRAAVAWSATLEAVLIWCTVPAARIELGDH
jgi:hypothetical protein